MSRQFPTIEKNDAAYNEVVRILGRAQCIQVRDLSVVQISNRYIKGDVFVSDILDPAPIKRNPDGSAATRRQRFRIPKDSFLARRKRVR